MTTPTNNPDWEHLINEQKASGLTQKSFCRRYQLNFNQFSYQKQKRAAKHRIDMSADCSAITFKPVVVESTSPTQLSNDTITITLANSVSLQVAANKGSLKLVLSVLGDLYA